ncbi:DUF1643 domain-containing protein [Leptothoe spongobia]|uniref:DUF1643 domain-containing protein n=1 Tax=Leptothoe spongobia TAU-MAC 1115 TaxID=1967444 RepID=A0A947DIW8_9CYAN|nr:DUF1643 domain-containing protein [Leptothoe spongobia]MBT9317538.1 DUF1643 domain-containing protein [Leptothoe spongobia TAU-MAC 1115]
MLTIVTNYLGGSATFDISHKYRYRLTRSWSDTNTSQVTFIMLNPSQANAEQDDPTIRACSQFAQSWGYTHLSVVNLFAYRTSQPSNLKLELDPIGPDNDRYLIAAAETAKQVILAWGNWGTLLNRAQTIAQLLTPHRHKLYCLKHNRSGQPRHPLYIRRNTTPILWTKHDM